MPHQNNLSPTIVSIFGASGDLTKRKLIPALYNLFLDCQLPEKFTIIGVGRSGSVDAFRENMKQTVGQFSRRGPADESKWHEFAKRIEYFTGLFEDPKLYSKLAQRIHNDEAEFGEPA